MLTFNSSTSDLNEMNEQTERTLQMLRSQVKGDYTPYRRWAIFDLDHSWEEAIRSDWSKYVKKHGPVLRLEPVGSDGGFSVVRACYTDGAAKLIYYHWSGDVIDEFDDDCHGYPGTKAFSPQSLSQFLFWSDDEGRYEEGPEGSAVPIVEQIRLEFTRGREGRVKSMTFYSNGIRMSARKIS
jgi:hypothetical protein